MTWMRNRFPVPLLLLAACWTLAPGTVSVAAEQPIRLEGKLVRFTAPSISAKPVSGFLYKVSSDSAILRVRSGDRLIPRSVPIAAIQMCEIRSAGKSHLALGAFVGMVIGVGAAVLERVNRDDERESYEGDNVLKPILYVCGGAVAGGGIGALVRSGVWREVSVYELTRLKATGTTFTPGLTFTLRF